MKVFPLGYGVQFHVVVEVLELDRRGIKKSAERERVNCPGAEDLSLASDWAPQSFCGLCIWTES